MIKLKDILEFQEDFVRLTGYTEDTPFGDYLLDIPKEELSKIIIETNEHGYTTWEVFADDRVLRGEFGTSVSVSRFFGNKAKKLRIAKDADEDELRRMEYLWAKYQYADFVPIIGEGADPCLQGLVFMYEKNNQEGRELAFKLVEDYIGRFKRDGLPDKESMAKLEGAVNSLSTAELDLVRILRKRIKEEGL